MLTLAHAVGAPAKLTLRLAVTGVRADGYHLIDAEMVRLDLADTLVLTQGSGLEVRDRVGRGIPVGDGPDNLVRRALAAAGAEASVRLTKRIPAGGGLGGGSADAAAVLRWAGSSDVSVAARLGADVPFCLAGGARARVAGIGEVLEPLDPTPVLGRAFTLLTPPFGVSTVAVYREWDAMGGPTGAVNDLEAPALRVEPRLAEWRDRLGEATGQAPVLAGSGSTWFVEGDFPGDDRIVARVLADEPPVWQVRPYRDDDAAALAEVMWRSVREAALADYRDDQVAAWLPAPPSPAAMGAWAAGRSVVVAVDPAGRVGGYSDVDDDGHIDHLYCAPEAVGTGAAAALHAAVEVLARRRGVRQLTVEASEAARRFYTGEGFTLLGRQDLVREGVELHNFRMAKTLA